MFTMEEAEAEMQPGTGLAPQGGLAAWAEPCPRARVHSPERRTNPTSDGN